jgi:hypothetical protein
MDIIRKLINEKYILINTDINKSPKGYSSGECRGIKGWQKMSYNDLLKEHNYDSNLWGIRLGKQKNDKFIISLDFDICGEQDKITKLRVKSIECENYFNEYFNNIDRKDGLYKSSTQGNYNLLIDISSCPLLLDKLINLNTDKFDPVPSLEFKIKNFQNIPPSVSICKITGKIGEPREFLNDKQFYILSNNTFLYNYLFKLIDLKYNDKLKIMSPIINIKNNNDNQIIKKIKIINNNNNNNNNEINYDDDKWMDLLFNVIKNDWINWDRFFKIAGILKSNKYDINIWLKFCNLNKNNNNDYSIKTWNGIKKNDMSIYGLINIVKEINPYGYKEWFLKHKQYINIKILDNGENDIAIFISNQMKIYLKYSKENWILFDNKINLWRFTKNPEAFIISFIQNIIDSSRESLLNKINSTEKQDEKDKLYKIEEKYINHRKLITKAGFSSQIIKCLKEYLLDDKFIEKLDTNMYIMAFENGILDLTNMTFREGLKAEDFLTKTLEYNYEISNEEDEKDLMKELKKILNYKDDDLEYFLSALGCAFTGDSTKIQKFFYLRGQTASNGKSVIFESLIKIFDIYCQKCPKEYYETSYKMRHKDNATWKGLRLLWVNELSDKLLDAEEIKENADGTSKKYNKMWANSETMQITFKLFITSNHTLNIKMDAGIARRLQLIQMNSSFSDDFIEDNYETKEFKNNKTLLNDMITKYKYAFINIIGQYCVKFYNEGELSKYPDNWIEELKEIKDDNNKFQIFFNQYFEESNILYDETDRFNNFYTTKTQLDDIMKKYKINVNIKDEFKKMKKDKYFKYQSQDIIGKKKGIWYGFQLLDETAAITL